MQLLLIIHEAKLQCGEQSAATRQTGSIFEMLKLLFVEKIIAAAAKQFLRTYARTHAE